ncbi:hypothetical protein K469DRAFT_724121 [Zopfia rhizophila CBS 207.26]|uniref:Heterokaryon incompatibility domain-containing protein n=1 Tax=Zopfia rhizophila CBS 207.26 TaxID=1314779 RepID=A0A6A6D7W9_9PEZI|nr:hypothetical protein K469DRAFT_724121 [Zopfia rhizophila CBS 207.26]
MSDYRYSQLSPTSIRLLRLLPSEKDTQSLQYELFEYPIQSSDTASHPYKALSYVWGSKDKPRSIIIANQNSNITQNLYAALLHLQNHTYKKEKESQILLMAEIYAKASRVVVWLGEAKDNSDRALKAIRLIGENSARLLRAELAQQAIVQLLQQPWFRRVWVIN